LLVEGIIRKPETKPLYLWKILARALFLMAAKHDSSSAIFQG
jgi:hypothetical protein